MIILLIDRPLTKCIKHSDWFFEWSEHDFIESTIAVPPGSIEPNVGLDSMNQAW